MDKLYIIAHNWEGIELTIETYFTSLKVMKRLGELLEEYPIKPNPEDDPEEFLSSYYQWLRDGNSLHYDIDISLKIININ